MYFNNVFASFDNLSHKLGLPESSLFRYFQVRCFLQHHRPNFPNVTSVSGLGDMLEILGNSKRLISRINYRIISLQSTALAKLGDEWVEDTGEDLEEDTWDCALQRVNDSTSCKKLSLIQQKVLHRVCYYKARLAKTCLNSDARCDSCRNSPTNLTHMFWSRPALSRMVYILQ